MRRAIALAVALALASPAWAADPPPWMPAPPQPVGGARNRTEAARHLRRQAAIFTGVGIVVFALGVGLDVMALDWLQGSTSKRQIDGSTVEQPAYGAANWVELAGGIGLMATGFTLVVVGTLRGRQARALEGW